jgi:hypothetical protein
MGKLISFNSLRHINVTIKQEDTHHELWLKTSSHGWPNFWRNTKTIHVSSINAIKLIPVDNQEVGHRIKLQLQSVKITRSHLVPLLMTNWYFNTLIDKNEHNYTHVCPRPHEKHDMLSATKSSKLESQCLKLSVVQCSNKCNERATINQSKIAVAAQTLPARKVPNLSQETSVQKNCSNVRARQSAWLTLSC